MREVEERRPRRRGHGRHLLGQRPLSARHDDRVEFEREQEEAAAAEAAAIGGRPSSEPPGVEAEELDPAQAPLIEAGEGESEGFELAEQELIEHASHGDEHAARRVIEDASDEDEDAAPPTAARPTRSTRARGPTRTQLTAGRSRAGPSSAQMSRSRCSERRSSRETCICETPTRSAISVWVRSSLKRRNRIWRSRSGRHWAAAKIVACSSTSSSRSSSSPIASSRLTAPPSSLGRGASRETVS